MTYSIFNRTPIKRSTKPVKKVSKARRKRSGKPGKLGIVRLYGPDLEKLREECYARDGGLCQICTVWLPLHGDVRVRAHMAHKKGKRNHGDLIKNVRILCYSDHIEKEHNAGGKPVPRKVPHE